MGFGGGGGSGGTIGSATDVALSSPANGQVLTYNSGVAKWQNQASSGGSNATTGAPGLVQLAGDLGGTATSPTTPTAVHLTGAETVAGVKTFSSIPVLPATTPTTSTQAATKGYVDANIGASVGSATPAALGSAAAGSSTSAARQDHVHPTTGLMLTTQQTSIKAVNIYTSGAYPTRPSGYGSVEWIGPVDPGASAQTNDTWINTA